MNAVEIRDLSLSVGDRAILHGLHLDVEENTITIITGPSGSGKTTLLKVLAGYIPNLYRLYRLSGTVRVFGMQPLDALLNGLVSYIPQDTWSFFIGHTVCDELTIVGVENVYSNELCSRPMEMLSDGELYDMLIQLSLDLGAKLVLVDEPSTHLDSDKLKHIMERFRSLADEGKLTVVVADHGYQSYMRYIDTVVELAGDSHGANSIARVDRGNRCDSGTAIRVDNLWVRLGNRYIVRGLSLEVGKDEIIALYGRNGSGKTTLIKVLAGLIKPVRGSVKMFGDVFYIPQRPIYWFSMSSVGDELKLYSKIYGRDSDTIDRTIELFNLSKIIDRDPYTVSVGEARRLSLALSYIASPKILLLDEPTLGLDRSSLEILFTYLSMTRESGRCVVMATHNRDVMEYADRVVELERDQGEHNG